MQNHHWHFILWIFLSCSPLVGCVSGPSMHALELPAHYQAPSPEPAIDATPLTAWKFTPEGISPGDSIEVGISLGSLTSDPLHYSVRVDETGSIRLPEIGEIEVENLSISEAETKIASVARERGIYQAPRVTLSLHPAPTVPVRVTGAVAQPGLYRLPSRSADIGAALSSAGNLTSEASAVLEVREPSSHPAVDSTSEIQQIGHSVPQHGEIEHASASKQIIWDLSRKDSETVLSQTVLPGTEIHVVPREPASISVKGWVNHPGRLTLPAGKPFTITEAIAQAGGTSHALADRVTIRRKLDWMHEPIAIRVGLREARLNPKANLSLASGDVLELELSLPEFSLPSR